MAFCETEPNNGSSNQPVFWVVFEGIPSKKSIFEFFHCEPIFLVFGLKRTYNTY